MRISDWSSDVCSSDLPERIEVKLVELPTKRDLTHTIQWVTGTTAVVALAVIAMVVGGIVGGLAWLRPDQPATPQVQAPPPAVIYLQPPAHSAPPVALPAPPASPSQPQ